MAEAAADNNRGRAHLSLRDMLPGKTGQVRSHKTAMFMQQLTQFGMVRAVVLLHQLAACALYERNHVFELAVTSADRTDRGATACLFHVTVLSALCHLLLLLPLR
jgi:hypothetical protein